MPDKSPDQMSRAELLEARTKVEAQIETVLATVSAPDRNALYDELKQILDEVNAELSQMGEPPEVQPAETEIIDPDFGADDTGVS